MVAKISMEDRIVNNSVVVDSGCWIWVYARSVGGYGLTGVYVDGKHKVIYAHRASYETFVGPIPDGMTLDHLCRERSCVNWRHLEPVTLRVNLMRGYSAASVNAKKTHCGKCGEALTFFWGQRGCRQCYSAYRREKRDGRQPHPYRRWTQEEISAITAEGHPIDTVLSTQLGRSIGSIQFQRTKWRRAVVQAGSEAAQEGTCEEAGHRGKSERKLFA